VLLDAPGSMKAMYTGAVFLRLHPRGALATNFAKPKRS